MNRHLTSSLRNILDILKGLIGLALSNNRQTFGQNTYRKAFNVRRNGS
jgi:hypothetical protein